MTTYLYDDLRQTAQQYKEIINQPIFALADPKHPKRLEMLKLWFGRKGISVNESNLKEIADRISLIYFQSPLYIQTFVQSFTRVNEFISYIETHPKTPTKESDMDVVGQLYAGAASAIPSIQQLEQQIELYVVSLLQTLTYLKNPT